MHLCNSSYILKIENQRKTLKTGLFRLQTKQTLDPKLLEHQTHMEVLLRRKAYNTTRLSPQSKFNCLWFMWRTSHYPSSTYLSMQLQYFTISPRNSFFNRSASD